MMTIAGLLLLLGNLINVYWTEVVFHRHNSVPRTLKCMVVLVVSGTLVLTTGMYLGFEIYVLTGAYTVASD